MLIRRVIDRINSLSPQNSTRSFEEFLRALNLIVGLDQLVANLCAKFAEISESQFVYLVLRESITGRYVGKHASGQISNQDDIRVKAVQEFNLPSSANLIKWLAINRRPLNVFQEHGVLAFLSECERDLLQRHDIAIVIPLVVMNRLTGVLFFGPKQSRILFKDSEIATLTMLANHCALAIEYASMYQFQQDKVVALFHSDRLSTVGGLAAGAAHEIRNPLTAIKSTVQYLRKELSFDHQQLADGIVSEVERIDQIIKGLLSFSKISEIRSHEVSLVDVLTQTLLLLEPELRKRNISVSKEIDKSAADITADGSQLKQVFVNLLLNSIQSMSTGGRINIKLAKEKSRVSTAQAESVSIVISDSGCGIPDEVLSRVFDPFFTTKEDGTGLGLSIAYGIISKHGGDIRINSRCGGANGGTSVTVILPKVVTAYR